MKSHLSVSYFLWYAFLSATVFALVFAEKCPPGTTGEVKGLCTICPPGTFSGDTSKPCKKCLDGYYNPYPGVVSSKLCIPCPLNSISNTNNTACIRCPEGHVRSGQNNCIRCKPGERIERGTFNRKSTCSPCRIYSISTKFNVDSCTYCPDGTTSNKNRTECIPLKCRPGYGARNSRTCFKCRNNSYRRGDMPFCERCPLRSIVPNPDYPVRCMNCRPGSRAIFERYSYRWKCFTCVGGRTTLGWGKKFCRFPKEKCPKGSFLDHRGDCESCEPSYFYNMETKRCELCSNTSVSAGGLQTKCLECPPNMIVFGRTAFKEGRCSCKEGMVFRKGRCVPCPAGSVRRSPGYGFVVDTTQCSRCKGSTVANADATECVSCPDGQISPLNNGNDCVTPLKCPEGEFAPVLSRENYLSDYVCRSAVTGCPKGTSHLNTSSQIACVDNTGKVLCPKGTLYNGDPTAALCMRCKPGYRIVTSGGVHRCEYCKGANEYSDEATSRKCKICGNGFKTSFDSSECYCDTGKYIDADGNCVKCPPLGPGPLPVGCF